MCHINVIINKKEKDSKEIVGVLNVMTYNSFKTNKDGDGAILFSSKGLSTIKSLNKIKYSGKYKAIISHQRYGTSGTKDANNAHPHIGNRFVLIHNGVFSNMGDNSLCDSIHFLKELEEKIGDNKDIYEPLKEYLATISGSFSIFLYDKKYKKLYYFKEYNTNMYLVENEDWLVMSTSNDNALYANWALDIGEKDTSIVKHEVLYEVQLNGDFYDLGNFKKKEYKASVTSYYGYGFTKDYTRVRSSTDGLYKELCRENKDIIQKALEFVREAS